MVKGKRNCQCMSSLPLQPYKFDYVSVSYLVLYFENYRYNLDIVIAW